jgi:UTP--glucose-1-phosphate uridylyltransferase
MQRLLLRAIREAVASGIDQIILIVAPGMTEPLYTPLQEALALAVVPSLTLHCCEQAKPEGLGDALLQAEALIDNKPFAVLLPDDIVRARIGRTVYARELRRMMEALRPLEGAHLVSVTTVPRSKMSYCGVAKVATHEVMPRVHPIVQLIEKPEMTHPICRSTQAFGIVGRYLLQPSIFGPLRALRASGQRPVHLTDALEHLRQAGEGVYAFELEATRHDVGEVLGQADALLGS